MYNVCHVLLFVSALLSSTYISTRFHDFGHRQATSYISCHVLNTDAVDLRYIK